MSEELHRQDPQDQEQDTEALEIELSDEQLAEVSGGKILLGENPVGDTPL